MRPALCPGLVLAGFLLAIGISDAAAPTIPPTVRYDAGRVSPLDATQVEHTFPFKNTGDAPLKIERISTTCGCTSAIIGAGEASVVAGYPTLAPGEETSIRVTVSLLSLQPGALHKAVSVYVEGNAEPAAIYEITGTLLPAVTFAPPLVDFGSVRAGASRSITLTATLDARLTDSGALPPLIASQPAIRIRPLSDGAATKSSPSSPTIVRTYAVSLAPDAPIGTLTGSIAFAPTSGSDALARTSVFVVGQVAGLVSAQPQAVVFGAVPAGHRTTRQIVLTGSVPSALKNRKITSESPWLTIGSGSPDEKKSDAETITITLRADAPTGVLQTRIAIILDNGQRLLLPVSAYVTAPAKP